jgi:short-subunit dehydrogenase
MSARTVLVTGASSGIGKAFADVFASHGFDLVITARRRDRLEAVASRLRSHGVRIEVIPDDLSDPAAPGRLCDEIAVRNVQIDGLVNNAGYGVPGAFSASDWMRHAAMLQVMMIAPAELIHRLLPEMTARGYGRIINVASLAALVPAPAGHTLYAATKSFLVKFSESLAGEVAPRGVHVTALCPGFTLSEFHDVTGTRAKVSQLPSWLWMDAHSVAEAGYQAVMTGDAVCVTGRVNRGIAACARVIPQSLLAAIGRRVGRSYRKS